MRVRLGAARLVHECLDLCNEPGHIRLAVGAPRDGLLLLGRVLGGISTSLLFSAFESWMVAEHRKRGYPEAWLAGTFSLAAAGNGFVAVFAGLLAQVAAAPESMLVSLRQHAQLGP